MQARMAAQAKLGEAKATNGEIYDTIYKPSFGDNLRLAITPSELMFCETLALLIAYHAMSKDDLPFYEFRCFSKGFPLVC